LAYFCTTQTLEARDARKLFLFIVILETAVTLESFGVYVIRLATGVYERAPEHAVSLLAFIFFLVALTSGDQISRRRRNIYSVILVMIGLTAILSRARTLWVQIFLCPFILLPIEKKTAVIRSLVKPAVLVVILLMPVLLGVSTIYRNVAQELSQRVVETTALIQATEQISPIISSDRRVVEVKSALGTYRESPNLLDFVVGFGNGAEFYAPSAALGMGSRPGYKHHIHNGYVSLFFRMGISGLTFFLLFAFSALRNMYTVAKQPVEANLHVHPEASGLARSLIPKVIFVYFVATLIELLTIYSFIGDIKWGILFGLFRAANLESGTISKTTNSTN
jgi:O-antigen ligase